MKASQVARQKLQLDVYRSLWGAEEFSTKLNVLLPALQTKFNGVECSLGDIKQFGRHEVGNDEWNDFL